MMSDLLVPMGRSYWPAPQSAGFFYCIKSALMELIFCFSFLSGFSALSRRLRLQQQFSVLTHQPYPFHMRQENVPDTDSFSD